jgi:hypothetical protein
MQSVAGVPYNFNEPWEFWFFIGKIISKVFFGNEQQLEWFNATRVGSQLEFIKYSNIQKKGNNPQQELSDEGRPKLLVIEVNFHKSRPGEDLKLFWKPARELMCQKVQECTWIVIAYYLFYGSVSQEIC